MGSYPQDRVLALGQSHGGLRRFGAFISPLVSESGFVIARYLYVWTTMECAPLGFCEQNSCKRCCVVAKLYLSILYWKCITTICVCVCVRNIPSQTANVELMTPPLLQKSYGGVVVCCSGLLSYYCNNTLSVG